MNYYIVTYKVSTSGQKWSMYIKAKDRDEAGSIFTKTNPTYILIDVC